MKKLIVISSEDYPNGGAAANRHMALLSALVKKNVSVNLFTSGIVAENKINGIKMYGSQKKRNKLMSELLFLIRIVFLITYSFLKKEKAQILYLSTSGILAIPLLFFRMKRVNIYHERTELPELMVSKSLIGKVDYVIYKKIIKKFDGVFVITKNLLKYFNEEMNIKACRLHLLEMTVDLERFNTRKIFVSKVKKNIMFCGDLSSPKDGVDILLKAFKVVLQSKKNVFLTIIGNKNTQYYRDVINPMVETEGIRENVFFLGYVESSSIPEKMNDADIFVLARPQSKQAFYGFPTKLGEYLAAKRPVVVTKTSEISNYLIDGYSAFLCEADDHFSFSERIIDVLDDFEKAESVAMTGYLTAKKYFSSEVVAEKMYKVIFWS